jgi:hypothetical protein
MHKTRRRWISTLHVERFHARDVFMACKSCGQTYRSEELGALVPPGANFGCNVLARQRLHEREAAIAESGNDLETAGTQWRQPTRWVGVTNGNVKPMR